MLNQLKEKQPKFFWDFTEDDGSNYQYVYDEKYFLSKKELSDFSVATEKVDKVFNKALEHLINKKEEFLLEHDFSEFVFPYFESFKNMPNFIGRYDWVYSEGKLKVLELNADTPGLLEETFEINSLFNNAYGHADVNAKYKELFISEFKNLVDTYAKELGVSTPNVVITSVSVDDHMEEFRQAEYLSEILGVKHGLLEDLETTGEGLFIKGQKVDIWFKPNYPYDFIFEGAIETVENMEYLTLNNKVRVINPISSYVLSSKYLMAFIWENRTNSRIFTLDEQYTIETYFLPTYTDNHYFIDNNIPYIAKPVVGRAGNSTKIYDNNNFEVFESLYDYYSDYMKIYQEFEPPTSTRVEGITYIVIFTTFVANGKYCGITLRLGDIITDDESIWIPIFEQ